MGKKPEKTTIKICVISLGNSIIYILKYLKPETSYFGSIFRG
jgi:hypothetical protein